MCYEGRVENGAPAALPEIFGSNIMHKEIYLEVKL